MSDFDSLFDDAMLHADHVIMERMSGSFQLALKSGDTLIIKAIYDTSLAAAAGSSGSTNPRGIDASFEGSALTVLGHRIPRGMIHGASVDTPDGLRVVAEVLYPDRTTTLIALTMPGGDALPAGNGVRFTR